MFDNLTINPPKQKKATRTGFENFYSYYASYAEIFSDALLKSAELDPKSTIYDPWNGSGTTTKSALKLGYQCIGHDINPAMIIVSAARSLPVSESSCLTPLMREAVFKSKYIKGFYPNDPLLQWLKPQCAMTIRSIERSIAEILLTSNTGLFGEQQGISRIASCLYLALFSMGRKITSKFRASNPTWVKIPKLEEEKLALDTSEIEKELLDQAATLQEILTRDPIINDATKASFKILDSTTKYISDQIDFVLTSPPYCTRIDYTVATSIELALLAPHVGSDNESLRKSMLGTPRTGAKLSQNIPLGKTCEHFLSDVKKHESKASSTYYFKTHLDYYQKLSKSLGSISEALKTGGKAIIVVQDSHYKEIHNDLPTIVSELAQIYGLRLHRRDDFTVNRNMVSMNTRATQAGKRKAVESVLCFAKETANAS